MGRELVGKRTRKGTEANLMRCDKEWKGGGEGEGEGGGGGRGRMFHLDRVRAIVGKGFDRRLASPLWQFSVSCRIPTH